MGWKNGLMRYIWCERGLVQGLLFWVGIAGLPLTLIAFKRIRKKIPIEIGHCLTASVIIDPGGQNFLLQKTKLMRKLLLMAAFVAGCLQLFAQNRTITGRIADGNGKPVVGASIVIGKTTAGTSSKEDGTFSLSVPANAKELIVSAVTFLTQKVRISPEMQIVLQTAGGKDLEVVVVAYGQQKRAAMTSAVSTIDANVIRNQQIVTVGQALQGTVPGVFVVNTNGQPGSDPVIRIRGVGSLAASSAPLNVIDGIPFDGDMNLINSADIDNISVLKDASATALYGSRGANGVILYNMKSGQLNSAPSIELSAQYGVSSRAVADYPYINTQQQFQLGWEALKNSYGGVPNAAQLASQNLIKSAFHYNPYGTFAQPVDANGQLVAGATPIWNDNWTKALETNNPERSDINLGVSGGSDHSKYYFSLGYLAQDGYVIKSNYKRISTAFNYAFNLKNWLQIGSRITLVSTSQNYPNQGTGDYADVVQFGRTMSSVFPIYARDSSGAVVRDATGKPIYDYGKPNPNQSVNANRPVLQLANDAGTVNLDNVTYNQLLSNLNSFAQVNFTKDLFFKSSFGINRSSVDEQNYQNNLYGDAASVGGRVTREEDLTTSWTWNNMLGYEHRWGEHHLLAMASYESYKINVETMGGSKTGFAFSGQDQLSNASTNESFNGYTVASTLTSYLGRTQYDFQNKYFGEFTVRRDGSSIFAPGYRYGTFAAGGVSWVLSREIFMAAVPAVSLLKIRGSYGSGGNNALLDGSGYRTYFPYLNTFSSGFNDLTNSGVYLSQLANAAIQWEKQLSANIGVDFDMFQNRLSGSVDFFQKNSLHLILNQPLPPSAGFGSVINNIGKVRNEGVEVNLGYALVREKNVGWDVNLNFATISNKIMRLLPGIDTFASTGAFRSVVGKSVYEYYLPVWAGVDPANGSGRWWADQLDANGNPTGKRITTDSYDTALNNEKWVGSGTPKVTGGFSTKFRYKALDMSILFNFALGGKYYDNNYSGLMNGTYGGYGVQLDKDELKRWQNPGDVTNVPVLNHNQNDPGNLSTRFLFSGNYIRLRDITLGYTVSPAVLSKVVKSVRVYVQADNIYTWDKLKKGSDPESSIDGYANGNAFPFKTFSAGFNFNF
jgi:TonB-linked SusC/RagA family outer membrane protein